MQKLSIIFMFLIIFLFGCSDKIQNTQPDISQSSIDNNIFFINLDGKMIKINGKKNLFGFIENPIKAGEKKEFDWFLWGDKSNLIDKKLKIVALYKGKDANNQEQVDILSIDRLQEINYYNTPGVSSDDKKTLPASTVYLRAGYSLPKEGTWLFQIYIDNKLYGATLYQVKGIPDYKSSYSIDKL